MKGLGNALKAIRKENKVSLQTLQDQIGISRQTLQHYESGKGRSLAVYMKAFGLLGYELGVLPYSKDEETMKTLCAWIGREWDVRPDSDPIHIKLAVLGNVVKKVRKGQKKSMTQMEGILDVSSHIYQSIEDGKPTVSLASYLNTFEALGLSCSIAYWKAN